MVYMAILLWHRPFARPLHNVVQAVSLLLTWMCLLVGESLFNTAASTGAISQQRRVRPCVALALVQRQLTSSACCAVGCHRRLARHHAAHGCAAEACVLTALASLVRKVRSADARRVPLRCRRYWHCPVGARRHRP